MLGCYLGWISTKHRKNSLFQRLNTEPLVRLKAETPQYQIKHSTTSSLLLHVHVYIQSKYYYCLTFSAIYSTNLCLEITHTVLTTTECLDNIYPYRNCLGQFGEILWNQIMDVHWGSTLIMGVITWRWRHRNRVNTITSVIAAKQDA